MTARISSNLSIQSFSKNNGHKDKFQSFFHSELDKVRYKENTPPNKANFIQNTKNPYVA